MRGIYKVRLSAVSDARMSTVVLWLAKSFAPSRTVHEALLARFAISRHLLKNKKKGRHVLPARFDNLVRYVHLPMRHWRLHPVQAEQLETQAYLLRHGLQRYRRS